MSLHTGFAPHDPQVLRLALTTVLRRKGRVLDAMADTVATLRRRVAPEDQQLLEQWVATRGRLATMVFTGRNTFLSEADRTQVAQLMAQAQQLEAQLSARSATFRTQTEPVTLEQVQAAIPTGSALVELVVYTPVKPPQHWEPARYVAYILPAQGAPTWVDLGETKLINQAVQRFRTELSKAYGLRVQAAARALDDLVMRPIRSLVGTAGHLLLAPDGELNLVPFGALVDETQQYLLARYTISYLTTGRELLRASTPRAAPQPPLVVGHPEFGVPKRALLERVVEWLSALMPWRSVDAQALYFESLPGTAAEVAVVQSLLPGSQCWTGHAATEAALKQIRGPQLVHLATHGFFLADQPSSPLTARALQVVNDALPVGAQGPPLENLLLRSGLVLASANVPQSGAEDGWLTALEVAGLDMWGTELVVLSACDTGRGKVRNGEGVYGLRRALVMAGAESQLISLWKVPDEATREFMIAYYQHLLRGEGRAEALQMVQRTLLKNPQRQHPFYWAAFILSGAWTPLQTR